MLAASARVNLSFTVHSKQQQSCTTLEVQSAVLLLMHAAAACA